MKRLSWQGILVLSFTTVSITIYLIHYVIFKNAHDIFFYMIMDIAFLPVQVLLVILVIQRLLEDREKRARLEKLNMVIGTFFSEVGTKLLTYLSDFDPDLEKIRSDLIVTNIPLQNQAGIDVEEAGVGGKDAFGGSGGAAGNDQAGCASKNGGTT